MIDKLLEKIENAFLATLSERMTIESEFNDQTLELTTYSYWDETLVSEYTLDLTPRVDAVARRINN